MEGKEYRYFRNCQNKICRVHIEWDEDPLNPRTEFDGHIGHMMCWHRSYSLGDKENDFSSPEDFLNDLVRNKVPEKSIINFIKAKKASNGLELRYNRKDEFWELWGYYHLFPLESREEAAFNIIEINNPIDFLIDDIIDAMSFADKWKLLEKHAGIVYLPLYLYDHSGLRISSGSFSDPWDSGQVGYIWTDKETILRCGGKIKSPKGNFIKVNNRNWKTAAYLWLDGEVKEYDCYLSGDCYGYIVDEMDMDDQASLESNLNMLNEDDANWKEDVDSCWGYYTSTAYPLDEIASEFGDTYKSIHELLESEKSNVA